MTTFKDFCPKLLLNESNSTFLVFADLLEETGRDTQAALIRASLRFRTDLTPTEQALLGVSHPLDRDTRKKLRAEERDLQRQFITELGPEIAAVLQNDPFRISFYRGVIELLDLSFTQTNSLPKRMQVVGDLCIARTKIASLPEDLQVGGNLYLSGTRLSPEAVARILKMPGLSDKAKVTGLKTAGFDALTDQVVRQTGQSAGKGPSR